MNLLIRAEALKSGSSFYQVATGAVHRRRHYRHRRRHPGSRRCRGRRRWRPLHGSSVTTRERDSGCGGEPDLVVSRRADAQVVPVHDLAGGVDLGRDRLERNRKLAGVEVLDADLHAGVMHHPQRLPERPAGCRSSRLISSPPAWCP